MARRTFPKRRIALAGALLLAAARTTTQTLPPKAGTYRFDPLVVRRSATIPVRFELAVTGRPSRVAFELNTNASPFNQPGTDHDMRDDGTGGDRVAGDGTYTVTFPAQTLLGGMTPDDVSRRFVGFAKIYDGSTLTFRGNIFVSVLTDEIPRLESGEIVQYDSDVEATPYVVNIYDPVFTASHDAFRATRRFYDFFPDDFDMVNVITVPSRFENRGGGPVRNDVEGIGGLASDMTTRAGSAGRLIHMSSFPAGEFFDGAENGFLHEIGHQWINNLPLAALRQGSPHWPLSSAASGVMGYGNGQGLDFPCVVTEERDGIRLRPRTTQPDFSDLDLYLMGFIPPRRVATQLVFADQAAAAQIRCSGQLYSGPITRVTIQDVIDAAGERRPAFGEAPTHFTVATIIVSEDRLLDPDALAFYSYFARRMELDVPAPVHAGLAKAMGKPFAVATLGIGSLDGRIVPRADADFTFSVDPQRLTSQRGQDAVFTVHVSSRGGVFTDPVSFGCVSWVPVAPVCRFDPPSVVPGAGGADARLIVSPPIPTSYGGVVYATSGRIRHALTVQLVVP